ncbi:MAG: hypothetical protein O6929_04445, partial [candidate division NC10 bacterium]|nr:hypothetical protein [candidate division NC10 bacterium]
PSRRLPFFGQDKPNLLLCPTFEYVKNSSQIDPVRASCFALAYRTAVNYKPPTSFRGLLN